LSRRAAKIARTPVYAEGRSEKQAEQLLVVLRQRVDRREGRLLRLRSGDGGQLLAACAARLPLAALQLLACSLGGGHRLVGALAVDAHARRDDELPHRVLGQRGHQHGCAEGVRAGVLGLLVHALPHADARCEVDDRVDALERTADDLLVADVSGDQLDVGCEVLGPLRLGVAVHLVDEDVERADGVARAEQLVGDVRADEPGATGDEDPLGHPGTLRAESYWSRCFSSSLMNSRSSLVTTRFGPTMPIPFDLSWLIASRSASRASSSVSPTSARVVEPERNRTNACQVMATS
jgi:hypothetical protein